MLLIREIFLSAMKIKLTYIITIKVVTLECMVHLCLRQIYSKNKKSFYN